MKKERQELHQRTLADPWGTGVQSGAPVFLRGALPRVVRQWGSHGNTKATRSNKINYTEVENPKARTNRSSKAKK